MEGLCVQVYIAAFDVRVLLRDYPECAECQCTLTIDLLCPGNCMQVAAEREPGRLVVTVSDNGVGLPPDFDLDASSTLGLQIVRTLVLTELGGTLQVAPRPGGGTICDDSAPPGDFVWHPEPPLEVPPANQGIQLYTPRRDVAPGTEWETCYAFRPDWSAIGAHPPSGLT